MDLSRGSVPIVLSRSGGISCNIRQCSIQVYQGYNILKTIGNLLYNLDRISHLNSLQKPCFLKITLFKDKFFAGSALFSNALRKSGKVIY